MRKIDIGTYSSCISCYDDENVEELFYILDKAKKAADNIKKIEEEEGAYLSKTAQKFMNNNFKKHYYKKYSLNHPLTRRSRDVIQIRPIYRKVPYQYTQHLADYCEKFTNDSYNFNQIIMNEVDYINKSCEHFTKMLNSTNYVPYKKIKN